jgi:hypothetical protein
MSKGPATIFLLLLSTLFACRSTKNIQSAIVKKDTVTAPVVVIDRSKEDSLVFIKKHYDSIQLNRINYTTFSAKVDVEYRDGDGKKYDVNANIRMYKDSVIWVSVTAILGIEGLRAYITKDSVKLLNKQDKVYTARSVTFLQEVTELPLSLSSLIRILFRIQNQQELFPCSAWVIFSRIFLRSRRIINLPSAASWMMWRKCGTVPATWPMMITR